MGRLTLILGAVLAALAAVPIAALAGYGQPSPPPGSGSASPDRTVDANGNPFSGGLAFDPAHVKAKVGQTVSWTNTDNLVPHTATEDHRLWRLAGNYGPPGNMGFGPGETVKRRFAAGTWHYFCEIHPTEMRGVVDVPVTLEAAASSGAPVGVIAIWSRQPLPSGQVFDVQRRTGDGSWRTVRRGTRDLRAIFGVARGRTVSFRARVRDAAEPAATSGYSPVARITVG